MRSHTGSVPGGPKRIGTPANATPMTYAVNGRQYVVVAAGGHAWSPLPKGDYLMAYALPE